MNQYLLLNAFLAAQQYAFCRFEKKWKYRVAVLFQNSITSISLSFVCFEGGVFVALLDDRSQNAYKVFYLWKVTVTAQILHTTIFIKIAEYEKKNLLILKNKSCFHSLVYSSPFLAPNPNTCYPTRSLFTSILLTESHYLKTYSFH